MIFAVLPAAAALAPALAPAPVPDPAEPTIVATVERDAKTVELSVTGCGDLSAKELARLLDLELEGVTSQIRSGPPLSVALTCTGDAMTIEIRDPLTDKTLRREVAAPPDEPGRERLLALAISELFTASWLELVAPPPEPERAEAIEILQPPARTQTPPREAVEAATEVARARTRPPNGIDLMVGAGVRGRALLDDAPLPSSRVDMLVRGWLSESVGLAGSVGWDFGQSQRQFGRIRGHAVTAAGGLAWRVRVRPVIGIGGHVLAGMSWAQIRGEADDPNVPDGTSSGLTADLGAGVGPRVSYGRLRVDFDGELGWMLRTPTGQVTGETPFRLGGLWVGAVVRIGLDLRARPARVAPRRP